MNTQKKLVAAALLAAALVAVPVVATADGAPGACTPSDARTESVPTQGEPTILVENPRYVPEVLEESHTVRHEAVTEQVRGGWHNFSPNKDQGPLEGAPQFPSDDRGTWQHDGKPIPPGHWDKTDGKAGIYSTSDENGHGSWFHYEGDQTRVVKDAWDEKVIDQEYVPAQGEKQILVDNPAYVPEKTVEYPAVVCEDPGRADPTTDPVQKSTDPATPEAVERAKAQPAAPTWTPEPERIVVTVTG